MRKRKDLCPFCSQMRSNIQRHIRSVHVHVCDICSKACSLDYNLREHIRLVHTDIKLYNCRFCELRFGTPENPDVYEYEKQINIDYKQASPGEKLVITVLKKYNVPFERKKGFQMLKYDDNRMFRYDFAIPFNNSYILIEYDGEHHGTPVRYRGIPSERAEEICNCINQNDSQKNWFAFNNDIPLLRLTYINNLKIEELVTTFVREFTQIPD